MSPRRPPSRRPPGAGARPPSRPPQPSAARPTSLDDIARAIDRLSEAGQLLRTRLDAIDPIEHPARWAGVNDEVRALDDRIGGLRDEQQRVALLGSELRPLDLSELEALRAATETVAELVRTAARIAAVAEAAVALADAAGAAMQKLGRRG
ncbi:MAG: hypothetical protein JNK56_09120 [Myxococcales bacterium]|nr:hypothetical protein [Myxococcales bacterium]